MKKARMFGLALIGAVALMAGCANDEVTATSNGDKAACATGSGEGCGKDKAAAATGCCKEAPKAAEAPKN